MQYGENLDSGKTSRLTLFLFQTQAHHNKLYFVVFEKTCKVFLASLNIISITFSELAQQNSLLDWVCLCLSTCVCYCQQCRALAAQTGAPEGLLTFKSHLCIYTWKLKMFLQTGKTVLKTDDLCLCPFPPQTSVQCVSCGCSGTHGGRVPLSSSGISTGKKRVNGSCFPQSHCSPGKGKSSFSHLLLGSQSRAETDPTVHWCFHPFSFCLCVAYSMTQIKLIKQKEQAQFL